MFCKKCIILLYCIGNNLKTFEFLTMFSEDRSYHFFFFQISKHKSGMIDLNRVNLIIDLNTFLQISYRISLVLSAGWGIVRIYGYTRLLVTKYYLSAADW